MNCPCVRIIPEWGREWVVDEMFGDLAPSFVFTGTGIGYGRR